MKAKIFTLIICLFTGLTFTATAQLNLGTGVPWGTIGAGEPLVLNEDFTGFTFFHTDSNSDQGNSDNKYDTDGTTVIYGFKNDTVEVPILGSTAGKITYYFDQCAFAPEWNTAYDYKDGGGQTQNVSNGFVEISREYPASGGNLPMIHGGFVVDLRALEFVEVIQWTHSSTGGNKRGVMCEFSVDDGASWDTLRYQPGTAFGYSFTKDPETGTKTDNGYRCDPSAYGMTWEDGIFTSNVMLRFGEAGGQTPRIHDLKVYGNYTPPTAVADMIQNDFRIFSANKKIIISEPADMINVYNITGSLVSNVVNSSRVVMDGFPEGIYIVKAQVGSKLKTTKVLIK